MVWRVESPGQTYNAGEGSVVYFDPRSGDTHLLSDFAAHILQLVGEAPLTTEELLQRLEPDTEAGNPEELEGSVNTVLQELVALDVLMRD